MQDDFAQTNKKGFTLLGLRHAQDIRNSNEATSPLTELGQMQATAIGEYISKNCEPDLIICASNEHERDPEYIARIYKTYDLLGLDDVPTVFMGHLYKKDVNEHIQCLQIAGKDNPCVMFVNRRGQIPDMINMITEEKEGAPLPLTSDQYDHATLSVISFGDQLSEWQDIFNPQRGIGEAGLLKGCITNIVRPNDDGQIIHLDGRTAPSAATPKQDERINLDEQSMNFY